MKTAKSILLKLAILVFALATTSSMEAQKKDRVMNEQVFYRTVKVDGLSIFYREADRKMLPPFFSYTVFHRLRGCFSRC